jgi:hypothetical protein
MSSSRIWRAALTPLIIIILVLATLGCGIGAYTAAQHMRPEPVPRTAGERATLDVQTSLAGGRGLIGAPKAPALDSALESVLLDGTLYSRPTAGNQARYVMHVDVDYRLSGSAVATGIHVDTRAVARTAGGTPVWGDDFDVDTTLHLAFLGKDTRSRSNAAPFRRTLDTLIRTVAEADFEAAESRLAAAAARWRTDRDLAAAVVVVQHLSGFVVYGSEFTSSGIALPARAWQLAQDEITRADSLVGVGEGFRVTTKKNWSEELSSGVRKEVKNITGTVSALEMLRMRIVGRPLHSLEFRERPNRDGLSISIRGPDVLRALDASGQRPDTRYAYRASATWFTTLERIAAPLVHAAGPFVASEFTLTAQLGRGATQTQLQGLMGSPAEAEGPAGGSIWWHYRANDGTGIAFRLEDGELQAVCVARTASAGVGTIATLPPERCAAVRAPPAQGARLHQM